MNSPIMNHGFIFPDLAAFPDYENEYRNEDFYDYKDLVKAYMNNDALSFFHIVEKYTNINEKWIKNLKTFFKIYHNDHSHSTIGSGKCYNDLAEKGLYITHLDFSDFDVSDIVTTLLKSKDHDPLPGNYDRGVHLGGDFKNKIQVKFDESGILKAIEHYTGTKRNVTKVLLHVSTPTDSHYKQFMHDAETTPRWTNTHIDPKEDATKAIIYLEPTFTENGAFGYVPKSNRFIHDPLQNIFGRAICTGNYCRTPAMRKSVFSLPKQLRVSWNFGRSILDGSPMAKWLDDNFLRVTSDMGNVAIFDSGKGMHQGGIVKEGRRVSLQVLMK